MGPAVSTTRNRGDLCPGAFRPWSAADGLLIRLRLIGGEVSTPSLRALVEVSEQYGDGRLHLTSRANLQLRGLPGEDGTLAPEVLAAVVATGLLPTRSHELIRNIMVSPQTGLAGGRTDLRPVAAELDARLCADPGLARLPGRFLFVLDDGRGDLVSRCCDLGLVVLDAESAQLRVGEAMGPVVPIDTAAEQIVALAHEFAARRGDGPSASWHVVELTDPLVRPIAPDPRLPEPTPALSFGDVPGGRHIEVSDAGLDRRTVTEVTAQVTGVVITPWSGVLVPQETS